MMRCASTLGALLFLAAFALPLPASAQLADFRLHQLQPQELEQLKRGRLIRHENSKMFGNTRLHGGTSWQRINAPPDSVWQAILDTPRYKQLLPQVREARVIQETDSRRLVYIRHVQGFISVRYHLVMNVEESSRIVSFRVDQTRPRSLSKGRGFIAVRPYGAKQSIVTFNIYADIGSGMVSSFFLPQIREGILRVPWNMKRYIEGQGRARYALAD